MLQFSALTYSCSDPPGTPELNSTPHQPRRSLARDGEAHAVRVLGKLPEAWL